MRSTLMYTIASSWVDRQCCDTILLVRMIISYTRLYRGSGGNVVAIRHAQVVVVHQSPSLPRFLPPW